MNSTSNHPEKDRAELIAAVTSRLDEFSNERLAQLSEELDQSSATRAFHLEVLATVPQEWREDFKSFIHSGEASPVFLAHLDANQDGDVAQAVNRVMEKQAEGLRGLCNALGEFFGG